MDLEGVIEFLRYFTLVLYIGLALASFLEWRRKPTTPGAWMAGTFGVLGLVSGFGLLIPEESGATRDLLVKIDIGVLVLFPYFLYRFSASFQAKIRPLRILALTLTGIVIVWTFLLGDFPEEGEPTPRSLLPWLVAFVAQWVVLSTIMAIRLWRNGNGQSRVARKRMRLMSIAAGLLSAIIIASGFSGGEQSEGIQIVNSLLGLAAVLALYVGYSPPEFIRAAWRKRPLEEMRRAVVSLLSAEDEKDVTEGIMPHVSQIVGARAVAFVDKDGRLIGSLDTSPEMTSAIPELLARENGNEMNDTMVFRYPEGSLVVWANQYAPFFGTEESDIIRGVGAMTELALEKTRAHELKLALAEAQMRRKQALQINDDIVQGLAVAKYAFELGQENKGRDALDQTLEAAKSIISDLLKEIEPDETLRPGSLVRDTPARTKTYNVE